MTKMMTVRKLCPFCGEVNETEVDEGRYKRYLNGSENIQDVFPDYSPEKREAIKTGFHDKCWHEMFLSDEDIEEIEEDFKKEESDE